MQARNARLIVKYNNKDISQDVAKHLQSFSFNDVMSAAADDIDITLEDVGELWEGDWLPDKGATLSVSIVTSNWENNGDEQLDLGRFELDEIELSGPSHEVKLKAVSIPNNNELRGIEKTRSWECISLSKIANDIAYEAGMKRYYKPAYDKTYKRVEQTDQSDLSFLLKLCQDEGLALKISDGTIIIFDENEYEQAAPVCTITKGDSRVSGWNFKSKTRDIYKACHVKYQDSKSGQNIEYTFKDPNKSEGKTLEVNEQVDSIAAAERLAMKKLREKNCDKITGSLNCMGNIQLMAGMTVNLSGWHEFDGKYIVVKGSHSIGSGYNMNLDLRRCLNGY